MGCLDHTGFSRLNSLRRWLTIFNLALLFVWITRSFLLSQALSWCYWNQALFCVIYHGNTIAALRKMYNISAAFVLSVYFSGFKLATSKFVLSTLDVCHYLQVLCFHYYYRSLGTWTCLLAIPCWWARLPASDILFSW